MMPSMRMFRVRNKLAREALAEFFGTFILMTFGDGSEAQALLSRGVWGNFMSIYWCWGIAVMMGVFVAGGVSGGHINPAVTVAKACLGYFPWKKVPVYILAQYAGSFVASVVVYIVYFDALNHYDGGVRAVEGDTATAVIWATYPQTYVSTWNCLGDQILGTALLLICILAITDKNNVHHSPGITVLAIGLSVVGIGMAFGLNCAYAINPTRDLAPRIFTAVAGWGKAPFSLRNYNFFWVPVVGPHVGAVLGAFLYQLFIGLHWSVEEEPTKDEKVFKNQEPTTDEVFKNHSSYNGHGLSSKFKHVSYTKAQWRGMYVQAVDRYWTDKILAEAAEKSSLKYMNAQKYSIGQAQLVWYDAGHDIMSVQNAGWKARLRTGTYMLQATRARFNQHQVDPTCLLCCKEPENVENFLLRCESLTQVRDQFLHKIYQSLKKSVRVGHFDRIKSNDTVLTTTILDCTTLIEDVREPVMDIFLHEIESTARGLCFALHMKRTALSSLSN